MTPEMLKTPTAATLHPMGLLDSSYLATDAAKQHAGVVDAHLAEVQKNVTETLSAIATVEKDNRLTPAGRREKQNEMRAQTAAAIRQRGTDADLAPYFQQQTAAAQAGLPTSLPSIAPNNMLSIALAEETRRGLKAMTAIERKATIKAAAEAGNTALVAAALADPLGQCVPATEDTAALVLTTLRAAHPGAWDRLDALTEVKSAVRSNEKAALRALGIAV